jgi:hypothetical chaperone protein
VLAEELGHDLAFAAERGKIAANAEGAATIDLGPIERGLRAPITRASLAHATAPHAARIAECAAEAVAMANLPPAAVDAVLFVGGSSLMHAVIDAMRALLPDAALRHSNAFTAVIDGLAIASARD